MCNFPSSRLSRILRSREMKSSSFYPKIKFQDNTSDYVFLLQALNPPWNIPPFCYARVSRAVLNGRLARR